MGNYYQRNLNQRRCPISLCTFSCKNLLIVQFDFNKISILFIFQILFFIIPVFFDLSYQIEKSFRTIHFAPESCHTDKKPNFLALVARLIKFTYENFMFILLLLFTTFYIYELNGTYSTLAAISSPLKTWNLLVVAYLRYKSMHLSESDFDRFIGTKSTKHKNQIANEQESNKEYTAFLPSKQTWFQFRTLLITKLHVSLYRPGFLSVMEPKKNLVRP